MIRILIAEDEHHLALMMERYLARFHYHVEIAHDGAQAIALFDQAHYDLVICDVMMPHVDGYELTAYIRQHNQHIPILMVTAKETLADKKVGFAAGTDDYVTKPIELDELGLRIQALLRRAQIMHEHQLIIGTTCLDEREQSVTQAGVRQQLAQKEFAILYKLLSYPNTIFTRYQLVDAIWGFDADIDERTVDVHIKRLREKVSENPDFTIVTVRGLGYKAVKR